MEMLECHYLTMAYEQEGNVRAAAKALGITPSTFVRKRKRYEETYGNKA